MPFLIRWITTRKFLIHWTPAWAKETHHQTSQRKQHSVSSCNNHLISNVKAGKFNWSPHLEAERGANRLLVREYISDVRNVESILEFSLELLFPVGITEIDYRRALTLIKYGGHSGRSTRFPNSDDRTPGTMEKKTGGPPPRKTEFGADRVRKSLH